MSEVYAAINAVQKALAVDGITKHRKNAQQGYNFRGIDDVYNALAPLLATHGLCMLPRVLSRNVVERESKSGSALFYITVEMEFDLVSAKDGSKHTIKTYGEAMDSGDKATNKAMSAAYKYAAMQAFSIPTEGDNDADSQTHEVKAKVPVAPINPATGAWESLHPDIQTQVSDIVDGVRAEFASKGPLAAAKLWKEETAGLDADATVAGWAKLPSQERSAMKKLAPQLKEAA